MNPSDFPVFAQSAPPNRAQFGHGDGPADPLHNLPQPHTHSLWIPKAVLLAVFLCFSTQLFACHHEYSFDYGFSEGHWSRVQLERKKEAGYQYLTDPMSTTTYSFTEISLTTSDCDSATAHHLLDRGYKRIAEESAQGGGAYMEALATSLGCPKTSHAELASVLKKNHETFFTDPALAPDAFIVELGERTSTNPALNQCELLKREESEAVEIASS